MPETAKNPVDKVRQLQRKLWVCAKQSRTRRFHALYDRIYRSDVLWEAWMRVRSNGGAAGVDEATLRSIEERGVTQFLEGIQADLKAGRYRPSPVRRRWIPKADGKQRPLGIPTVRDRVVQMAAKIVVEPIFEADFQACSYGFRPKRSATQALEAIRKAGNRGYNFVVDADIQGYFDSIDREKLRWLVKERISDRRVLKLIRQWLEAGVMEDGTVRETLAGTPQGGVISPLLANIYLNNLDRIWAARCSQLGAAGAVLRRFRGDEPDGIAGQGSAAADRAGDETARTGTASREDAHGGLETGEGKLRVSGVYDPQEAKYPAESSLAFHATVAVAQGDEANPGPRTRVDRCAAEREGCEADHRQTDSRASRLGQLLPDGQCRSEVQSTRPLCIRAARALVAPARRAADRSEWSTGPMIGLSGMGLYRLRATVKYPAQAAPRRSSLSRVQENCTHGLKGVC